MKSYRINCLIKINKIEYGSGVLIMSRLAPIHLSELRFGKFSHLKDGSQSCPA